VAGLLLSARACDSGGRQAVSSNGAAAANASSVMFIAAVWKPVNTDSFEKVSRWSMLFDTMQAY